LYFPAIKKIEMLSGKKYIEDKPAMRIIADHLKASIFIILSGVIPSNKEQGYLLRRLIRRSVVKYHELTGNFTPTQEFKKIAEEILNIEEEVDPENIKKERDLGRVSEVLSDELIRFCKSLDRGLKIIEKTKKLSGKEAFDLYQSYGFPLEITIELMAQKDQKINIEEFKKEFEKHKELSRTSSAGKFKGGLVDTSKQAILGHTATHLLHKALKDILGEEISQKGSNITNERIRFDFNYKEKITEGDINRIAQVINAKIKENLKIEFELMSPEKAKQEGAIGLFNEKYQESVKVYKIGEYSKEICGGPHVEFTGKLKKFKIIKQENIGQGQKRIYAKVGDII
ncbi:alanine--tRNA ligase, partial [Patescibacteria group bacterium]|nr:alanine--tRNA ligase [Patescibacteria group bacterium]